MKIDKFTIPYLKFIKRYVNIFDNVFVTNERDISNDLSKNYNFLYIYKRLIFFRLFIELYLSKKIIIHGLWSHTIVKILFFQPWLLKKSYWLMYGGDFYYPEKHNKKKHLIIRNMGYIVTNLYGDYLFVKKHYFAKGKFIKCFIYPSNLFKKNRYGFKRDSNINILVGNSADPSNNHIEILNNIAKIKNINDIKIKIYTPLSYGDKEYAKKVINIGFELFGEKYIPITKFMSEKKYNKFLSSIDIAIFNHKRQQAFGNTVTLLGFGKKVFINPSSTVYSFLKENNIICFDSTNINLKLLTKDLQMKNIKIIKKLFSKKNLINQTKQYLN